MYIIVLVLSVLLFGIGYHAIDLSYNMLKLSYEQGQDYYTSYSDVSLSGKARSYADWYRIGWLEVTFSFSLLVYLGILRYTAYP